MTPRAEAAYAVPLEYVQQPEEHEVYFGVQNLEALRLDSLFSLTQIRGDINQRQDELKESIRSEGLDNALNVAQLTRQQLQEYIEFINEVWESDHAIENFDHLVQTDGQKSWYNLVVAGNSRLKALQDIAEEDEAARMTGAAKMAEDGHLHAVPPPMVYKVISKILPDPSVETIVQKQASENIHTRVPVEREAMAIVELYEFGRRKGNWESPETFRQARPELQGSKVDEALTFAGLDKVIRSLIFEKHISYKAGIGLSQLTPLVHDFMKSQLGLDKQEVPDDVTAAKIQELVSLETILNMQHILNFKNPLSVANAMSYLRGRAKQYKSEIAKCWDEPTDQEKADDENYLFASVEINQAPKKMITAGEQARRLEEKMDRRRRRLLRELVHHPRTVITSQLSILEEGDKTGATREALIDIHQSNGIIAERLGEMASTAAAS